MRRRARSIRSRSPRAADPPKSTDFLRLIRSRPELVLHASSGAGDRRALLTRVDPDAAVPAEDVGRPSEFYNESGRTKAVGFLTPMCTWPTYVGELDKLRGA
jgi:hypothetical protein